MKLIAFSFGIVIGIAATSAGFINSVDIRLAVNATKMLDACESTLPRNEICLLVSIPQRDMPQGVPYEPPVDNSPPGDLPLLFPPQIQGDDPSFR